MADKAVTKTLQYNSDSDSDPERTVAARTTPIYGDGHSSKKEPEKVGDEEMIKYGGALKKTILEVGVGESRPAAPSIVKVLYKGYFLRTKKVFESFEQEPKEINLADLSIVEGLRLGIESMKKGEKALLQMQPRHGFNCENNKHLVKLPIGYENKREQIRKKRLAYEVKLVDFVLKIDVNKDGRMIKTILKEGEDMKKKYLPTQQDEVKTNVEIWQNEKSVLKKTNWIFGVDSGQVAIFISHVFQTMIIGEVTSTIIKKEHLKEKDKEWCMKNGVSIEEDAVMKAELINCIQVTDLYLNKQTRLKKLRKGKNSSRPVIESTIEFKMKVINNTQNNTIIFNNIPSLDTLIDLNKIDFYSRYDPQENPQTNFLPSFKFQLDQYRLPSVITKTLVNMEIDEIKEIHTIHNKKLIPNFKDQVFTGEWGKENDEICIFLYFIDHSIDFPWGMSKILERRNRIFQLKDSANALYKVNKIKKAAKLYYKMAEYFDKGDADMNCQSEKKDSPNFIELRKEIGTLQKPICLNLSICRFKMGDIQGCLKYTEKVLSLDPKSIKGLFWNAKALFGKQDYVEALERMKSAIALDPNNEEILAENKKFKEEYEKYLAKEKLRYSKMLKEN